MTGESGLLESFLHSLLTLSAETPLGELERIHQFLQQSTDLILQVIKVRRTLDASPIMASAPPPISIMQYQLQSPSLPANSLSSPPPSSSSDPPIPVDNAPLAAASPLPPPSPPVSITYDQLQFGDMTPQVLHEFTCPVLLREPTRKTLRDSYMYILIYDRITLKTYKPRQKNSGLTPTLGIRGELHGYLLGGERFTTVIWNDQIAKFMGISTSELVKKTDNLGLLEIKLNSLYTGRPLAISVSYRVYQQEFTSSVDSIGCLSWTLVYDNVQALDEENATPTTTSKPVRASTATSR